MHITRVLARSDQAAAEQLLEQGIVLAKQIEADPTSFLLSNAVSVAAAVSAKHALPLYAEQRKIERRHCVPPRPVAGRPRPPIFRQQPRAGMSR